MQSIFAESYPWLEYQVLNLAYSEQESKVNKQKDAVVEAYANWLNAEDKSVEYNPWGMVQLLKGQWKNWIADKKLESDEAAVKYLNANKDKFNYMRNLARLLQDMSKKVPSEEIFRSNKAIYRKPERLDPVPNSEVHEFIGQILKICKSENKLNLLARQIEDCKKYHVHEAAGENHLILNLAKKIVRRWIDSSKPVESISNLWKKPELPSYLVELQKVLDKSEAKPAPKLP